MSKWYSLHIKNEILLWFFIVSILPLLFMSLLYFFNLKSDFEQNTKKYLTQILNEKIDITKNYIDSLENQLEMIAILPKTKEILRASKAEFIQNKLSNKYEKNPFFESLLQQYGFYDIFLIDLDGNILYTTKHESDIYTNLIYGTLNESGLAWAFKNSKSFLNTEISTFSYYIPSKSKASFISTPIFDEKKMVGVLAIQISEKKLFDMIISYQGLGESGEVMAGYFNKNENVIAAVPLRHIPDAFKNDFVLQFNDSQKENIPVKNALLGNSGADIAADYRGVKVFAAWKYIPVLRWGMAVKIDYDEVMQPVYNRALINILILFFVILFISVAIIVVTKHIIDPIQILITRVKNISQGKVETPSYEEIDLDNEIGTLAKSFSIMSKSLYDSQEIIRNYATELETKVEVRTQELQTSKNELQEINKKMKKHLDVIDKYVITSSTDIDGVITEVSDALCKISGYSKAELVGKKHSILKHPDFESDIYKDLWSNISHGRSWYGEIKNQRKDGSFYWVDVIVAPTFDKNGVIDGYSSIRQDITDKKRVEELSITDQLTKIYNRLHLENTFKKEVDRAKRYKTLFSVILLDIDYFKSVNDNYGHDVGDEVLIEVVNILKQNIRTTDILGRWGGEEFLIVLPQTDALKGQHLAEKLRVEIQNYTFNKIGKKTCSFGISQFKPEDEDSKEVVKRADNALYEAKNSGRNKVVLSHE